jgi:hypothetical protein
MSVSINGTSGLTFNNASTQSVGGIGDGQTWQDLTASRALSTTYTNSTGKPIMVSFFGSGATASVIYSVVVNSVTINTVTATSSVFSGAGMSFIVPNSATYSITITTGAGALGVWAELR